MKHYEVIKTEAFISLNGKQCYAPVANYGVMCEEDMRLTVKGYKATYSDEYMTIYTRSNSKYRYEVFYC